MEIGWHKMADIFIDKKFGKEKKVKYGVDENILKLLGALRVYLVNNQFNCVKTKDQYLYSTGSNNITSDYDVQIIGKDIHIVMKKMFDSFLNKYHNTLPYTFDVNIYTTGFFTVKNSNKYLDIKKFKIKTFKNYENVDFFTIISKSNNSIVWALLKLIEENCMKKRDELDLFKKYSNIDKYIEKTYLLKNTLNDIYKKQYDVIKNKYKQYNHETLDIITKYQLQYLYSKKLNEIIYGTKKVDKNVVNNILSYAQYFSVESYYTHSTFNVVVLELQSGLKNLHINKLEYLCSAIENLGDLIFHYIEEKYHNNKTAGNRAGNRAGTRTSNRADTNINTDINKKLLLKYSKYFYRIYYSLGHALNDKTLLQKAINIDTKVVAYRSSYDDNKDKIDFSAMIKMPFNIVEFENEILGHIDKGISHLS